MTLIRVTLDDETYALLKATAAAEKSTINNWLRSRIEVAVRVNKVASGIRMDGQR